MATRFSAIKEEEIKQLYEVRTVAVGDTLQAVLEDAFRQIPDLRQYREIYCTIKLNGHAVLIVRDSVHGGTKSIYIGKREEGERQIEAEVAEFIAKLPR